MKPDDRRINAEAARRKEQIHLIEEALGAFTCIECDCGRSLDISRYIDREDIEDWLEDYELELKGPKIKK